MRKLFLAGLLSLMTLVCSAQLTPVTWTFDKSELGDNKIELQLTAMIEKGWELYGQDIAEDGPIPTQFHFDNIEVDGFLKSDIEPMVVEDDMFEMTLSKYKERVVFSTIITKNEELKYVAGHVRFMTCDGQRCLPPTDVNFKITL